MLRRIDAQFVETATLLLNIPAGDIQEVVGEASTYANHSLATALFDPERPSHTKVSRSEWMRPVE